MSVNPRVVGIKGAKRTTKRLGDLYGRMGSKAHPNGKILTAYRAARRGVADAYREPSPQLRAAALGDTLASLRMGLRGTAQDLLSEAYQLGIVQAEDELRARGFYPAQVPVMLGPRLLTWEQRWDAQLAWVDLQFRNGATVEEIVGDGQKVGSLSAGPILALGMLLLTGAAVAGWLQRVEATTKREKPHAEYWWKQAVATIDHRTTPCCLGVHGQAVPLQKAFTTKHSPAFADKQKWAPFHFMCRTVVTMLTEEEAKDAFTEQLRAESKLERAKRKTAT